MKKNHEIREQFWQITGLANTSHDECAPVSCNVFGYLFYHGRPISCHVLPEGLTPKLASVGGVLMLKPDDFNKRDPHVLTARGRSCAQNQWRKGMWNKTCMVYIYKKMWVLILLFKDIFFMTNTANSERDLFSIELWNPSPKTLHDILGDNLFLLSLIFFRAKQLFVLTNFMKIGPWVA